MRAPSTGLTEALSEETRTQVVSGLITRIQDRYDSTSVLLCTALITGTNSEHERQALSSILLARAKDGHLEDTLAAAKASPWLQSDLLRSVSECLVSNSTDIGRIDPVTSVRLLRCARRLISISATDVNTVLLEACLSLAQSKDRETAYAAKQTLFRVLEDSAVAQSGSAAIRGCTMQLLRPEGLPFQQTLGYTLWLRQLSSTPRLLLHHMRQADYWDHIARGLRHGDSEKRKLCLELLKFSVQQAAENDISCQGIVEESSPKKETLLLSQYARYCTVFETLTLARYQNLLLETQQDLSYLTSNESLVHPRWLFVLLETALDHTMSDACRQTIGGWILNGGLQVRTDASLFNHFLGSSLLPWLTDGRLYVSSLKQASDRSWHCMHGERVATYVRSTLEYDDAGTVVVTYLKYILDRRSKIFAHAAVYILNGVSKASSVLITDQAYDMLCELYLWQNLPDVGKECFRRDCRKLLALHDNASKQHRLPESYEAHVGDRPSQDIVLQRSGREVKIEEALQKCARIKTGELTTDSLSDALDDLWSDAEYLVYPRELVEAVPSVLLSDHVLQAAKHDDRVKEVVGLTIGHLLDLVQTRSNILGPLMLALLEAVARIPRITDVLSLEEILLDIARAPPTPKPEMQFEYAVLPLLASDGQEQQAATESRGYAAYILLVASLRQYQGVLKIVSDSIISRWRRQKIPAPAISAFKTTLQLQTVVLCLEQRTLDPAELQMILDDLLYLLSVEPLPRYRYLLSWMVVRLLIRRPDQHERLLQLLQTKDHHANPKYLAALMKLSMELVMAVEPTAEFTTSLASIFVVMSSSSKVVIRHEAQWSFPLLMQRAREQQWSHITDNIAYKALDEYIRSLPRFDDRPVERTRSTFNPVNNCTLTNLCEGHWTAMDCHDLPYTRHEDLQWLVEDMDRRDIKPLQPCLPLGPVLADLAAANQQQSLGLDTAAAASIAMEQSAALQTKGTAYLEHLVRGEDETRTKTHELIVIASLVTNPYNLGGLSRVSEIFGVQTLCLGDPKVVSHKDFTSVAVSSHNHLDIQPLEPEDIAAFVEAKKNDGWTVVGVEQTDRSDLLGSVKAQLPSKTILVIGNEREGMPGFIISQCDMLMEIPQVGMTRSMNVQTVAAVVLYEFNRQHALEHL